MRRNFCKICGHSCQHHAWQSEIDIVGPRKQHEKRILRRHESIDRIRAINYKACLHRPFHNGINTVIPSFTLQSRTTNTLILFNSRIVSTIKTYNMNGHANGTSYKFEGWLGKDKSADKGNMVWEEFEPKPWEETDVDIEVTHCGICGSDLHTLRSGWGETPYPCCVGHEIVGRAVRVGSQVNGIKVGDRVGVGAQSDSCQNRDGKKCDACASGNPQYCLENVGTYSAYHFNGGKSYGGYATHNRCPSKFVIPIPEGISSAAAAPMLCGGVTLYSPLKHYGCGPGKRVGIVGVGGLGHFGVLFAKALGADHVVGISRKADKKKDVLKLGADAYLASDDKDWTKDYANSLDLIISTVSSPKVCYAPLYLKLHPLT